MVRGSKTGEGAGQERSCYERLRRALRGSNPRPSPTKGERNMQVRGKAGIPPVTRVRSFTTVCFGFLTRSITQNPSEIVARSASSPEADASPSSPQIGLQPLQSRRLSSISPSESLDRPRPCRDACQTGDGKTHLKGLCRFYVPVGSSLNSPGDSASAARPNARMVRLMALTSYRGRGILGRGLGYQVRGTVGSILQENRAHGRPEGPTRPR